MFLKLKSCEIWGLVFNLDDFCELCFFDERRLTPEVVGLGYFVSLLLHTRKKSFVQK